MLIVQRSPYSRPIVLRRGYPGRYAFYGLGEAPAAAVPAIAKDCPSCPPGVSCAPCNPYVCPALPAGCKGTWTQTYDNATKQTMCVLPSACVAAPATNTPGTPPSGDTSPVIWAKAHPLAVAGVFAIALFTVGAAVAFNKKR